MRQVARLIYTGYRGKSVGLTIPKAVSKESGLQPGDRVMVTTIAEGKIMIEKEIEDIGQPASS